MNKKEFDPQKTYRENLLLAPYSKELKRQDVDRIDPILAPSRTFIILRKSYGLKQTSFSNQSTKYHETLSQSYVSKIEKFESIPTYTDIIHFCTIMNLSPERFFYFVFQTQDMTMKEAILFIRKWIIKNDIESNNE